MLLSVMARAGSAPRQPPDRASQFLRGALVAALAAACFGVTAPVIERMGRGGGPLTTAALLYVGACASALFFRLVGRRGSGRAVTRADLPRLALVALSGAAIAPTLFAWGLQRMGA